MRGFTSASISLRDRAFQLIIFGIGPVPWQGQALAETDLLFFGVIRLVLQGRNPLI
jgi:hypothetical protein